jgi:hypothetical protein
LDDGSYGILWKKDKWKWNQQLESEQWTLE